MIRRALGPHARAAFTDRSGGLSDAPYDSLNLGVFTDDDPAAVARNYAALQSELGLATPSEEWVRLHQVHGTRVIVADDPTVPPILDADAAVTAVLGRPLVVVAADCAPIALASGASVAVVHAGWRGIRDGAIEATIDALRRRHPGEVVYAVLGPCVHVEYYEFGADDLEAVAVRLGPAVRGHTVAGTPALDLPAAVRAAMSARPGVEFDDVDVCTFASPDHFSYRRDGETGRHAVVAWLS
jgi:YfiH family protein